MTAVVVALLVAATSACASGAVRSSRRGRVTARLSGAGAAGIDAGLAGSWRRWSGQPLVVAVTAAAGVGSVVAWPLAPLAALIGAVLPGRIRRGAAAREARLLERQLPDALGAVARSLRSGAATVQALAEAGSVAPKPLGPELERTATAAGAVGLDAALAALVTRRPVPGVRLAAAVLALGGETGGPLARGVDGVAATLRQRLAVQGEAVALSTQARVSGWLIAGAPVVFGGLAGATDPRAADWLLRTPAGLAVLVVGLGLDVLGAWWMTALTRRIR